MNPWKITLLELLRDILRFSLWIGVVVNGLMLGVFSIAFCYQFLTHMWRYCSRTIFGGSW